MLVCTSIKGPVDWKKQRTAEAITATRRPLIIIIDGRLLMLFHSLVWFDRVRNAFKKGMKRILDYALRNPSSDVDWYKERRQWQLMSYVCAVCVCFAVPHSED